MKFKMIHENYNVSDLDRSIKFYNEALDLHEVRRKTTDDFIIVYLSLSWNLPGLKIIHSRIIWVNANSTWHSRQRIMRQRTRSTKRWGAFASKMKRWESISL
jgi:hypothetical protein